MQLLGLSKVYLSAACSRADGKGRVPAVEVMLASARVRECIDDRKKQTQLGDAIARICFIWNAEFDQSLMKLYTSKMISYEEALRQSSNPDDFALKVSGISSTSDASWDGFESKENEQPVQEKIEIDQY